MTIARMGAAAALAATLAAAGVAAAGESPDPTATTSPTTTVPTAATVTEAPETTYGVGNAGTVTVLRSDDGLQITAAAPAAGWTVDVEQSDGVEVDAVFTSETVELRFHAELEDGTVRTEVRSAAPTTAPTTTPVDDGGTDAEDFDDSGQEEEEEETVDEVARGTEWASTHVPDHVDLTSRPASLRASATVAHAGRGGDVDLEITREDGELTVRAGGSLRSGHDD